MGKKNKRKRTQKHQSDTKEQKQGQGDHEIDQKLIGNGTNSNQASSLASVSCVSSSKIQNPLWVEQDKFLQQQTTITEREHFFADHLVDPERRAEIWMAQSTVGERLVNRYAWATPNDRALRILQHFSPLIEIGCGSNAYWCRLMKNRGVDVIGFDTEPEKGGQIATEASEEQPREENMSKKEKKKQKKDARNNKDTFQVQKGGPEVIPRYPERTLFLCYPDEENATSTTPTTTDDDNVNDRSDTSDYGTSSSMAATCLEHYQGDYVIHIGELLGQESPILSMEQAPWGRSSSPAFQERLAAEYHCILRVSLPNWLHTMDRLTVWKRSPTTTLVFANDDDIDDTEEEEVEYRYIPPSERLPVDCAAPCLEHLLLEEYTGVQQEDKETESKNSKLSPPSLHPPDTEQTIEEPPSSKDKKRKKTKKDEGRPQSDEPGYQCPW